MKRIIFVNNNMKIGGVQKSLYNLLWELSSEEEYAITLLLFSKSGPYVDNLPKNITVLECPGLFKYLGISQAEAKNSPKEYVVRGLLATICRLFGRATVMKLMLMFQPKLSGCYEYAISFLHNGREKAFYGGTQEYVLNCINARSKIAFLHCDYLRCGAHHTYNDKIMSKFDIITACSDGCRAAFEIEMPDLRDRCVTVTNCHNFSEIKMKAAETPVIYDKKYINVVSVSRLSSEKGIERAIKAISYSIEKGIPVNYHIIGDGTMYDELDIIVKDLKLDNSVFFYGEQDNPYRYIKNADLLLISSYHEAAPMVIDEARCLGVPVLSTRTTSSFDMITLRECGWVCENTLHDLKEALYSVLNDRKALMQLKETLIQTQVTNNIAISQFKKMLND